MIEQYMIDSITRIANHPNLIKKLESYVAFPLKIETWMTKRVLYAITLLYEEAQKNGVQSGTQGNNKHTNKRGGKGVHKVSEKRNHPA